MSAASTSRSSLSSRSRFPMCEECLEVTTKLHILGGPNSHLYFDSKRTIEHFFNVDGDEYLYRSRCSTCLPYGCNACEEVRAFMYSLRPYRSSSSSDRDDRIDAIKTYAQKRGVEVLFYPEFNETKFNGVRFDEDQQCDIYYCRSCRDVNHPMYCGDFRFARRHSCYQCLTLSGPTGEEIAEAEVEKIYSGVAQEYDDYFDLSNGGKICRKRRRKNPMSRKGRENYKGQHKEKTTRVRRTGKPNCHTQLSVNTDVGIKELFAGPKRPVSRLSLTKFSKARSKLVYSDDSGNYHMCSCDLCDKAESTVGVA